MVKYYPLPTIFLNVDNNGTTSYLHSSQNDIVYNYLSALAIYYNEVIVTIEAWKKKMWLEQELRGLQTKIDC